MEIIKYDRLAISDQGDYIALLVTGAHKILVDAGQSDQAAKFNELFTVVHSGDQMTIGMLEPESNIDKGRLLDAERHAKDHNARRLEVEDAMFVTLKRNGILMPKPFMQVTDHFKPKKPLR